MNKHYDSYLVKKYEPLYRERFLPMSHTAMCWGFEVGDGWFNIINSLSYHLCCDWLQAKSKYEYTLSRLGKPLLGEKVVKNSPIVTMDLVEKEKTRVDEEYDKVPIATQVKEKFGTLRFYVHRATPEQYSYINFAESMSAVTCEVCGDKGKRNNSGWLYTRCKKHRL